MNRAALNPDWSFGRSSRAKTLCVLVAAFTTACGGGGNGGSKSSNPPPTSNITVSVSPVSVTVAPSASVQFTATVTGTSNTTVMWTATASDGSTANVGLISASGVYTAPGTAPSPSAVNIKATSVVDTTKSGNATANILVHHINQDAQSAPIKLGTSGGNITDQTTTTDPATGKRETFCCSGTLGSLISRGGNLYVLSNNHVLDKSDQGVPGQSISQPGLADTHCGQDPNILVATLSQAAPLKTSNVDAAIAQVIGNEVDPTGTIYDLAGPGQPAPPSSQIAAPTPNQQVAKSGDATGLTCASIMSVSTTVSVDYQTQCQGGDKFTVLFKNQILIGSGSFSNNGDSGSLVVTTDTARPVGLLYAGSASDTVAHPIGDVLTALKDPNSPEVPKMVGIGDHPVTCPATPQSERAQSNTDVIPLSKGQVNRATSIEQARQAELMQDSSVSDVAVGRSEDNPKEAAILVFLRTQPRIPIPAQIDGVRTKLVRASAFRIQRAVTAQITALPTISDAEILRAKTIKEQHAQNMMSNPAILGVGVGASQDSPGESAIVVFVEQGKQVTVPAEIHGVRTRVIETDRFRTFNWGKRTVNSCSRR